MITRLLFGITLCACAAVALAQPRQTYWPGRGATVAAAAPSSTLAARMDCDRPDYAAQPGQALTVELNLPFGFDEDVRLLSGDATPRATIAIQLDSLLRYEAFTTVTESGFDTVRVEGCNADGACEEVSFVFAAGRAGTRRSASALIEPGEQSVIGVATSGEDLFCGSFSNRGDYDARARRTISFQRFPVSDSVVYQAARAPGFDEFEVVVCDVFGTCDTTLVGVSIPGATLDLPFCDDFSGVRGPRPDRSRWLEDDVYVNDALAVNAPSVGVASFDGLDEGGLPYGEGFGNLDQLTTTFIDLTTAAGTVYVKFYLQLGGLGQAPERSDQFIVEGRDRDGEWVELIAVDGSRSSTPSTDFDFYALPLADARFVHEEFQVRFRMTGNLAGGFDNWNLDYVRVEEGDALATAPDIALTLPPRALLTPYSAVPYSQFVGNEDALLTPEVQVGLYNHFATSNNVTDSRVVVEDALGGTLLEAPLLGASQLNLPPGSTVATNTIAPAPFGDFVTAARAASREQLRRLDVRYELDIDDDQSSLPCVQTNDTARSVTVIDDYFAYDDGTAESALLPGGAGEELTVRYTASVQDTLRGIRMAFPRLGPLDADGQFINLRVYIGQLDDEPEYEEILVRPYFPAAVQDTLNALTTFGLFDALGDPTTLIIPAGDFYVGWQQVSDAGSPVPVGLDLAYDNADAIFTEFGRGWQAIPEVLPQLRGSLMVHPVFSDEELQNSSPAPAAFAKTLRVFPNPTGGDLTLDLEGVDLGAGARYTLRDAAGRVVQAGTAVRALSLDVARGLYTLTVTTDAGERLRARVSVVN